MKNILQWKWVSAVGTLWRLTSSGSMGSHFLPETNLLANNSPCWRWHSVWAEARLQSHLSVSKELYSCLLCFLEQVTSRDSVFLSVKWSKTTVDSYCSHEIKRHLFLGRKAMTNSDNILKSRDIILLTKVHIVKVIVFPVVMYRCEGWTIKKAECRKIDAFKPWRCRRLLKVPWTARRSNKSILNIHWKDRCWS